MRKTRSTCRKPLTATAVGAWGGRSRARPFGFLRLDMRPGHALSIEPHTFAFEAELGYQNTWALSENVEKYLKTLEPSGRRDLDAQMIQAIQDLPGENYLLDVESATLDVALHYKISSQWRRTPARACTRLSRRTWTNCCPTNSS